MQEIELKCQIPAAHLAALRADLQAVGQNPGATLTQQRLQARYFDTPSRHLAQARAALRLRREGDAWVQTLKALATTPGATHLHRLEHNAEVGDASDGCVPALHLGRHLHTPAADALAAALNVTPAVFQAHAQAGETLDLAPTFETDIHRTQATLMHQGACIELALDEGEVRADGRVLVLCELEMELRSGPVAALIDWAQHWVQTHGLWLDVRSKAERGERLARAEGLPLARPIARPVLPPDGPTPVALRHAVAEVVNPLLALGSVVADPALTAQLTPEHLRHWHRGLGLLHQALAQAAEPALVGGSGPGPAGLSAAWAESLMLLLAPLDAAGPQNPALWARAARSARAQHLMLALLGWLAA
jgi:triphosphatase